nr:MAG TPA: hypothetical protein [Caudoviricetes sp.]
MDKSELYTLGLNVRDALLKKNGHFTVREFKRSMNLCLYKAMDPDLRQRYMVSFFLNACAIYAIYDGGDVGWASLGEPKALPEVDRNFPSFEDGVFEIKKVMYAKGEQNFDVGKVITILYQLDKQYGWELYESAKRYGK